MEVIQTKKLAIITPTLANGGAERVISTISQSKQFKEQYSLTIITFDNSTKDYVFKCEIINLRERFSKELDAMKFLKYINYFRIINIIKKEMDFDIVLSFMENMGIVNAVTKRNETTIHAISSYLSGQFQYSKSIKENMYHYLFRWLIKICFNKLDGILSISQESKLDLIDKFKIQENKVHVSYNPYDINNIQYLANKSEVVKENDCITIVTMGSLIDVKSQWNVIRAFKEIVKQTKNCKLLIIGRGSGENYLREMAEAYNIIDQIEFLGYVTNPFKYLKNSDIYILSSVREGLPNALIEAMSCGLPVISTDCSSGPREIIAPSTNFYLKTKGIEKAEFGILIPMNTKGKKAIHEPLDEQEKILKEAIEVLINDEELRRRYSSKSIERSLHFDTEIIIPIWIEAIEHFDDKHRKVVNEA